MTDLLQLSALDLAGRIRRREVSSVELTKLFLERIDRYDGELNAFVTVLRRRSLLAAHLADRRARDLPPHKLGIFNGVPCGIKDLVPMFGTPTKFGSNAYKWFVSPFDGPEAKLLKRAGFVFLGKLSTSEMGVLPITEPKIHPPTRNPWNLDHTPGGSSGGSGAAVAAGLIPLAHGSDGGGSIRIPSAFCHLYGFKPSLSLTGNLHGKVNTLGLSVAGPLAHYVEDAAAMMDVLRGHADGHLHHGGDFCLSHCQHAPRRLRVRVALTTPICSVDPVIADGVRKVAKILADMGHEVEEAPKVNGTVEEFLPLWQAQLASVPTPGEGRLEAVTRWLRAEGRKLDPAVVEAARKTLAQRLATMFGDADILLSPTVPVAPPRVGEHRDLPPREQFEAIAPCGSFTALFNVAKGPAANIPAGLLPSGLPFGVQIGAKPGQDGLVFALSRQLEEAMPWRQRRPVPYFKAD